MDATIQSRNNPSLRSWIIKARTGGCSYGEVVAAGGSVVMERKAFLKWKKIQKKRWQIMKSDCVFADVLSIQPESGRNVQQPEFLTCYSSPPKGSHLLAKEKKTAHKILKKWYKGELHRLPFALLSKTWNITDTCTEIWLQSFLSNITKPEVTAKCCGSTMAKFFIHKMVTLKESTGKRKFASWGTIKKNKKKTLVWTFVALSAHWLNPASTRKRWLVLYKQWKKNETVDN